MGINRRIYLFSKTPYEGVIHVPIIQTRYLHVTIDITQYNLIVLTSKEALNALEYNHIAWQNVDVIAVSEATAEYARSKGAHVIAWAKGYGDGLYDVIHVNYANRLILFPSARILASDFAQRLQAEGRAIERVTVYETSCNDHLEIDQVDEDAVLAFSSPSSVECFMKNFVFAPTHKVVVIGTTTANALPLHVSAEVSEDPSIKSLVAQAKRLSFSS